MSSIEDTLPPHIILTSNTIYAIQGDIYALDPSNGTLLHYYPIDGLSAFTQYKTLKIHALQKIDGSLLWERQIATTKNGEPGSMTEPVANNIGVIIGNNEGSLSAFNLDEGALLWSYRTNGTRLSKPIVSQNGIFIGINDSSIAALNAEDGTYLWQTHLQGKKQTLSYQENSYLLDSGNSA